MAKLYFMQRVFEGHSWTISYRLEDQGFRKSLVFEDSWYFLHYCFFRRDSICSETSAAVQTHLYNLASVLYRDFEALAADHSGGAEQVSGIITELVEICEYSSAFPVCLWIYGDETNQEFLAERLAPLPSPEQMASVLSLPHMTRHDSDRLPYRYSEPEAALKRYRNAQADFNRRRKLAAKNEQRARVVR